MAQSADAVIAAILSANKLGCAEIVERNAVATNQLEVTCVDRSGGTGRVRYLLDITTGIALRPR